MSSRESRPSVHHGEAFIRRLAIRIIAFSASALLLQAGVAEAQAAFTGFPPNYPGAPTGSARQDAYPYPGQCWTVAPIPGRTDIPQCTTTNARSFACEP
jgi:hypothetical protein